MKRFNGLVLQEQRHLKWHALDPLENILMILCGIAITGFSIVVLADIITRAIGHPLFWAQETMMSFFIYGIFAGRCRCHAPQRSPLSGGAGRVDERAEAAVFRAVQPRCRARSCDMHELFWLSQLTTTYIVEETDRRMMRSSVRLERRYPRCFRDRGHLQLARNIPHAASASCHVAMRQRAPPTRWRSMVDLWCPNGRNSSNTKHIV